MVKNIASSVCDRLKDAARKRQRPFNELLQYYAMERLLYRLANSSHKDRFILKGALMMLVWNAPKARPTKDIDLLGYASNSLEDLQGVFSEICALPVEDGIVFDADNIEARRIKEDADYEGARLIVRGLLGTIRLTIQIDIGFGDAVHPAACEIEYPTILDVPAPRLRGYVRETVVAEKTHAMVTLEMLNSRMKDFYDVWLLSKQFEFDYAVLRETVEITFRQRGTGLSSEVPLAFTEAFSTDSTKKVQWAAFTRRMGDLDVPPLPVAVSQIATFLGPVLLGEPQRLWTPGGPWLIRR